MTLAPAFVPLLNDLGNPVVYDAALNPDGPPPECCCQPTCCWETVAERPAQLLATVDVADCCWDGAVVPFTQPAGSDPNCLVKNSGNHAAVGCDFGAANISVILCCLPEPVDGKNWKLTVQSPTPPCSPVFIGYANVDSCDPFSITFTGTLSAGGLCTECVNGTSITVLISE